VPPAPQRSTTCRQRSRADGSSLRRARDPGRSPRFTRGTCSHAPRVWRLVQHELQLGSHPLAALPIPKVPDVLNPSLTAPEMRSLLAAVDQRSSEPVRDRALVLLMLDTAFASASSSRSRSEMSTSRRVDVE
jgi:integrase